MSFTINRNVESTTVEKIRLKELFAGGPIVLPIVSVISRIFRPFRPENLKSMEVLDVFGVPGLSDITFTC